MLLDVITNLSGEPYFQAEIDMAPEVWARTGGNMKRRFTPKRLRAYYEELGWLLKKEGLKPIEGPIGVAVVFNRRKNYRVDLDNLYKALMDACKPFFDDSQVIWMLGMKRIGVDKDSIELTIWRDTDEESGKD